MRKGLTRAGIGGALDIESFAQLASRHGFTAVDVGGEEIVRWIAAEGLVRVQERLSELHVGIGAIGLCADWRGSDAQFRAGIAQLAIQAEAAASVGCQVCCTYALPSVDANPAELLSIATVRLRTCARVLDTFGLRLALEFVGPHHLRRQWRYPFVQDSSGMLDWIGAIGERSVGLLLDSLHWYTTAGTVSQLEQFKAHQIVHVHINDAPDVPVSEVRDDGRLYPGEGVIDLTGFLRALSRIGYEGVVSQEVLTPQPPTHSPEQLASRSARLFDALFQAAVK
ncbi:MAG: sugar phosphate isomerase/epimerase [Firmicutes bacterium]|nr:sugar phosphate isomerase/epimerase [Bacillota bacterium]